MNILLIDHQDSFTQLLAYTIQLATGVKPHIIDHKSLTYSDLLTLPYTHLVLSPGPGHPGEITDFSLFPWLKELCSRGPVLGVCLGMQALALAHGGALVNLNPPKHGWVSKLHYKKKGIFTHFDKDIQVVRYHSLGLSEHSKMQGLKVVAWAEDDLCPMAIASPNGQVLGLQFHPEALSTYWGLQILQEYFRSTQRHLPLGNSLVNTYKSPLIKQTEEPNPVITDRAALDPRGLSPCEQWVEFESGSWKHEQILNLFTHIFPDTKFKYWLELEYESEKYVLIGWSKQSLKQEGNRVYTYNLSDSTVLKPAMQQLSEDKPDILSFLEPYWESMSKLFAQESTFPGFPSGTLDEAFFNQAGSFTFPWEGAWVGYLGYECLDCYRQTHLFELPVFGAKVPDSAWMRVEDWLCFVPRSGQLFGRTSTLNQIKVKWEKLSQPQKVSFSIPPSLPREGEGLTEADSQINVKSNKAINWLYSRSEYTQKFSAVRESLLQGNSYETCLTNFYKMDHSSSPELPLALFKRLLTHLPGAYSAFLSFPWAQVVSHSPELFLRISDNKLETQPIKGTKQKGKELSHKEERELRIITDLLRNDVSVFAQPGSLKVSSERAVTHWGSLQQQYSCIEARLEEGSSLAQVIRASFPGGSVTGAPKYRTRNLLGKLEKYKRGPYTGAVGFLGPYLRAHLNVAIRTLFSDGQIVQGGAGGGLTVDSQIQEEWDELIAKAQATLQFLRNE